MAWEWEMTLGMDFGMGMGDSYSTSSAAIAEVEVTASPASLYALPSADTLRIDGVLDFSGHDLFPSAFGATAAAADTLFFTAANPSSADTSFDLQSHQTPFDFYAPCEEAAELEWLSQFVEDSFSDVPCQYTGLDSPSGENQLRVDQCITNRAARSRRSKPTNPSAVWSSLTQPPQPSPSSSSSSSSSDLQPSKPISIVTNGKGSSNSGGKKGGGDGGVRRCTHCASEKTPQWRTGPLGPKTLCNACGVRHKSGRLVPEYRPAASPTFVLAQHSNSHRKVMELRRQKELLLLRHKNQPSSSAAAAKPELLLDDYNVG